MTFDPVHHIIPLVLATVFTFGSMMPLFNPTGAIRAFGLPEHIAMSPQAHACFTVYGSRMSALGMAIWIFYLKGNFEAVDTILALIGWYCGAVDGYVCWQQGVPGKAIFRMTAGFLVGGWGMLGLTAR